VSRYGSPSRGGRYAPLYAPPRFHRDHDRDRYLDADAAADARRSDEETRDDYADTDPRPVRWGYEQ
jgi:hypothetical protein